MAERYRSMKRTCRNASRCCSIHRPFAVVHEKKSVGKSSPIRTHRLHVCWTGSRKSRSSLCMHPVCIPCLFQCLGLDRNPARCDGPCTVRIPNVAGCRWGLVVSTRYIGLVLLFYTTGLHGPKADSSTQPPRIDGSKVGENCHCKQASGMSWECNHFSSRHLGYRQRNEAVINHLACSGCET